MLATSFRPTAWTTPQRHGGSRRGWGSREERQRPLVHHVVGETLHLDPSQFFLNHLQVIEGETRASERFGHEILRYCVVG